MDPKPKINREFIFRYIIFGIFVLVFYTPTLFMPRRWLYRLYYPIFNKGYLWAAKIKAINLSDDSLFKIEKPMIFAPVHKCYADSIILGLFLRKPFTVLMDMANRNNNPFFRFIAWKMGLIPIDRDFTQLISKKNSIEKCIREISVYKYSLVIFPEGRHYYEYKVGPLKKGVIKVAKQSGADIVPVAIYGITGHFVFEKKLVNKNAYIKFGTPFNPSSFENEKDALVHLKLSIEKLYDEIEETNKSKEIKNG